MRKKSVLIILIPLFLIFSFGLQSYQNSSFLRFQSYISDVNISSIPPGWSNATVISDDATGWNDDFSQIPRILIDSSGNVHVVWADDTNGEWGTDWEIMYVNYTATGWSNATVVSDDATGWNDGHSFAPDIAIDGNGTMHIVWFDTTNGEWGTDTEIMYSNNTGSGWSNATVISDVYGWNNGTSEYPDIAIDSNGNVHVVWHDQTFGEWGIDIEIMYANNSGAGWSNATVISDDFTGWNSGSSRNPSIVVDGDGNAHVVWQDDTNGEWGTDEEILYAKHTAVGWSNVTVISDIYGWNNGSSEYPDIAIDSNGNVHVVWNDGTDGEWGTDYEIMYTKRNVWGWFNATVISDDATGWNNGTSYIPDIEIDGDGNLHVVWDDVTTGEWGTDQEIMYINRTGSGWSNATIISDDMTGWNNGSSAYARIAIDSDGNMHVVWHDWTAGGTDFEIMYVQKTAPLTGDGGEPSTQIIPLLIPDSSISLLSPLGLAILGITAATVVIITIVIVKKIK